MDTYHDIDSLVNESNIPKATNLEDVRQLNQGKLNLFHIREDKNEYDDDEEDPWEPEMHSTFFRVLMTSNLYYIIFLVVNKILIDNWKANSFFFFFEKRTPICESKTSQIAKVYLAKFNQSPHSINFI